MAEEKTISGFYNITSIFLNPKNKRHIPMTNESLALREMLENEKKHKISELASDIIALGVRLDPSVKLIITPIPGKTGNYIVLEGNRRITALKTLINPGLAEGLQKSNTFKQLSKKFHANPIRQVECVELNEEEAQIWIKRKHYNGMGGAATLEWDAIAKARSDAEEGRFEKWYAAVSYLTEQGYDCSYIYQGLERKSTSADRVLKSKHMHEILGVTISNADVTFENGDEEAGCTLLIALFDEMIKPSFKEPKVTSSELIKGFLSKFSDLSVKIKEEGDDESAGKGGSGNKPDNDNSEDDDKGDDNNEGNNAGGGSGSKGGKNSRAKLASKGLEIPHTPLSRFYGDLIKLPTRTYPFVSSAMPRIFLEKLTMLYLEQMKISHPGGKGWEDFGIKLQDKVKAVVNDLDPKKKDTELRYARDIANGVKDKLHTIDLLHRYIHDVDEVPLATELNDIWDRLHPYFQQICNKLNQ